MSVPGSSIRMTTRVRSVEMAVLADMAITERQKRVLIDVYTSFVKENEKAARPNAGKPQQSTTASNATTKEGESDAEKETSTEARKSALESDYAALYAVAGLTDALADALKGALADTQQKASKRLTELQSKRPELSKQAKAGAEEVRTFVITLPEQFKHLPEATKARIAELQKQANELLAQATTHLWRFRWTRQASGRRGTEVGTRRVGQGYADCHALAVLTMPPSPASTIKRRPARQAS